MANNGKPRQAIRLLPEGIHSNREKGEAQEASNEGIQPPVSSPMELKTQSDELNSKDGYHDRKETDKRTTKDKSCEKGVPQPQEGEPAT